MTAFAFSRLDFLGRRFWFGAMLLTMMLPYHVTLIPQYVLFLQSGLGEHHPAAGRAEIPCLRRLLHLPDGAVLPRASRAELQEAAEIDGCGPWRIYWHIMLPLSVPVLATAAIFTFIWSWDDFLGPLVYLGDVRNYTVALGLRTFVDSQGQSDWSAVFAMSNLVIVPVFLVFVFFQRFLIEGIATSGLKG